MTKLVLKVSFVLLAALQSACATVCLTPTEIESNHINQYGSITLGKAFTRIENDVENFKEIDTKEVRTLINNPEATPFVKTQLYILLAKHFGNIQEIENLIAAQNDAINADGFKNIEEKNAYIKFAALTEERFRKYSKSTPENFKENAPSSAQVRFAPSMPYQATKSGYCYIEYDVSAEGRTENLRPLYCTTGHFRVAAMKNVAEWRFFPKRVDSKNVKDFAQVSKIAFRLTDGCGNLIPQ